MSLLSPVFFIGHIRIGSIEGASCLNMGNNLPVGFESHKKQNQGFGSISGDGNTIQDIRSLLEDSKIIDMLSQDNPEDIPDWVKQLILSKANEKDSHSK